jgi:inner membrane protein
MGKTHKVGGTLAAVVASRFFYSEDLITTGICIGSLIIGSVLGSLLPDIDKKESTIGRILWFISWPIYILRVIMKLLAKILPGILKKPFKEMDEDLGHRGVAHSLITWLVLSISFWLGQAFILKKLIVISNMLPKDLQIDPLIIQNGIFAFLLGVSIGMLSHILLDILTNDGVALLSPFIDTKFGILSIKTRSFTETVIRNLMVIVTVVIVYKEFIFFN